MKDFSFVDKIISGKGHLVHKIRAKDKTGKKAYYFVLVEPTKEAGFMRAIASKNLNLEEYGKIIASCYGNSPSQDVKTMLKQKYDFDIDAMAE